LDIDIISHRSQYASGQSLGWVDKTGRATIWRRGQLALPHPESHRRNFVLQLICDIMPHWHHPVYNSSAQQLLRRLPPRRQSRLVQLPIDHMNVVCKKQP
jgi:7,8-dihydro-6-hydroxymethylpterin-pyrophosphokinase